MVNVDHYALFGRMSILTLIIFQIICSETEIMQLFDFSLNLETEFLWLSWNLLDRPVWPRTHPDPPASAF